MSRTTRVRVLPAKGPLKRNTCWARNGGPGATRTRDLLLRSAGHLASRRQPALVLPEIRASIARWRSLGLAGIVIKIVINTTASAVGPEFGKDLLHESRYLPLDRPRGDAAKLQ
jgi:hypothetical protein